MRDDHSTRAGSLHATLHSSIMEIDDDDEDIPVIGATPSGNAIFGKKEKDGPSFS